MAQPAPIRCQVQFGPFTADLRTGELSKYGVHVKLQDRPFAILSMLLEHPGEVVTREEMRSRLWPDGTFVDFDNNISSAIGKLRAALGDSAAQPQYIATVGRGYRLIAEVQLVGGGPTLVPIAPVADPAVGPDSETPGAPPARSARRHGWLGLAVFAGLLAIAIGIGWFQWSRSRTPIAPATARIMLAVLPFDNLTGDHGQDYFSDGLTEEMITELGRLDPNRLGVIARTSVVRYKDSGAPLPRIGAELGVQYVLEGSVRREAGHVRITAQLIQVRDQTHLWSREYDRELKDLLAVETEIAQEIGSEVLLAFDHEPGRKTVSTSLSPQELQAYDLYLKGEYFLAKRTVPDLHRAIDFFHQAATIDQNYARAYAGLADSYALLAGYSAASPGEFLAQARAAALRALELDDRLPDAHAALALVVQNYDWDWRTAEKEFRRAIALDPNYVTAHHWYAEHLMWQGRFQEALRESEQARRLDPLSLIITADNAAILYYSRQYDASIREFRGVLDMDPTFPRAQLILFAYAAKGMYPQALALLANQPVSESTNTAWNLANIAYMNGMSRHGDKARRALEQLQQLARHEQLDPAVFVWAYLGIGDKDQALNWLGKAYAQHSTIMTALLVEPAFDTLRGEPRFQALLARVTLAH